MGDGDGDGWRRCARGHVHWGRHGAAGLLAFHRDSAGQVSVLLHQRAWWTLGGRTWGLLSGGRHSHESAVEAALREAGEESTLRASDVWVHGTVREDHGGWSFDTVVGSMAKLADVRPASRETRAMAWVPLAEVERMRLFGPLAAAWPRLRKAIVRPVMIVDAANVVGARPDGWWRDRAGATARLRDQIGTLVSSGIRNMPGTPFDRCFPELIMVVEGKARDVASGGGVKIVPAPGSGDDAIVEAVKARPAGETPLVVTADRELRDRCAAAGAAIVGPRYLLDRLPNR